MCIYLTAACLHALALILRMNAHLVSVSSLLGSWDGHAYGVEVDHRMIGMLRAVGMLDRRAGRQSRASGQGCHEVTPQGSFGAT